MSLTSLKKSVLLFDVVGVIDSQPILIRNAITREKTDLITPEAAEQINAACLYLADVGALEIVDSTEFVKKYDSTLTAAVQQDISDEEFCRFAVSADFQIWTILRERLPPNFLEQFYAGAGTFSEAVSLQAIVHTSGTMEGIPEGIKRFNSFRHPNVDPAKAWAHFLRRYRFVIGGNPHIELPAYQVPFLQASSLRINEALLVANSSEWIPFTDSAPHHRMLEMKIARGRKAVATHNGKSRRTPQAVSAAKLSVSILDAFFNEADFEFLSFEDLIRYREHSKAELQRFRSSILSISRELVETEAQDGSTYTTAAHLAVLQAKDSCLQVKRNWIEFLQRTGIRAGLASGPAAALAAFGDISFKGVLIAAGAATAVALNSKGPDDLIRLIEANRSTKSHAFCYLTNFPRAKL